MELLTVKAAMEIIPLGKTKVTAIINSLPHINTGGKLLFARRDLEAWITRNKVTGKQVKEAAPQPAHRKKVKIEANTHDWLPFPARIDLNNPSEKYTQKSGKNRKTPFFPDSIIHYKSNAQLLARSTALCHWNSRDSR